MIGPERVITGKGAEPLRPADLINMAVQNSQVETLTLNPHLQSLANKPTSTAPSRPGLKTQAITGGLGVLATVIGAATGSEALASAGAGTVEGSVLSMQRALSEYDADMQGFEEGLRRIELMDYANDLKLQAMGISQEHQTERDRQAQQYRLEAQEAASKLLLDRQRELEELRTDRSSETARIQSQWKNRELDMRERGTFFQRRGGGEESALTKDIDRRFGAIDKLREDRRVAEIMQDDNAVARADARIQVQQEQLQKLVIQEEASAVVPGTNLDNLTPNIAKQWISLFASGGVDPSLAKIILQHVVDAGLMSEDSYTRLLDPRPIKSH